MSLRNFLKYTAVGRYVLVPYRFCALALPHLNRQIAIMVKWAIASKEHYNYTYDLTELNRQYLDCYVSVVSGHPLDEIERYSHELETDNQLREILRAQTLASIDKHSCDAEPRYGRRSGWYALVRATKPRIVFETGVDRGLGTAVIAAALRQNAREGFPGVVHATDIARGCGHLLAEPYKAFCRIWIGDSVETLKSFKDPVDIFLHDSDHRPEYEWAEFVAIKPQLHASSLVLSDNSQQTSKLFEFARAESRSFLFFQDVPQRHWWVGDGIGAAFVPGVKTIFQTARIEQL